MMKAKRNDPCPCGSGKKYKKCCMIKQDEGLRPMQDIQNDIHNLLAGRDFDSMEELQELLNSFNLQKNIAPIDDFHGLSSEQMHRFLHMPFDSPQLVSFPGILQAEPEGKAAFILSMLLEGIGEDGMKLTAKGNLGQKFCQEASKRFYDHYPDSIVSRLTVRTETNFEALHTIRITAQLGGLVRKYKGKLLLTKKCRKAMDSNGMKALYPLLLHAYIRKFNWGYRDRYDELNFIQQSYLVSLYLLHKYGNSRRPAAFYSDSFLQAFPMILQEIEPKLYEPPEDTLRNCYILRTLQRFAGFFGLADVEQISEGPLNREYRIRATGLLDEVVQWHL